jgi:hypothetical protein
LRNQISSRLFLAVLSFVSVSVSATIIDYTLDNLGGSSYQYNYTFKNNTLDFDVDQFSIYYDLDLYENLAVTGQPADWIADYYQPDPFLPDDGFFDAYTFLSPIAEGESLGGFSVIFNWTGGAV